MAIGKLKTVVLDAPDIARLSAFYSELAGWTQRYADHEWITMTTGDGWRIGLQSAPDHVPPQWPDASHPQQAHLDLRVPDLAAGTQKAIELGAELVRENERWNTLTDPAGHPFDLCVAENNETTTLMGVMLDCPDATVLATFYSSLLGKPVSYDGDGVAMIGEDGGQPIMFQQIENYQAPRWPDPAYPQQFHLDVTVDEIEAAEQGALALGATRLDGEGENWRVYADPAGKPFCLLWGAD
jgi:catechol-2,3-dioxygenase